MTDIQDFEFRTLRGIDGILEANPAIGSGPGAVAISPMGAGTDPQDLISFLRDRGLEL